MADTSAQKEAARWINGNFLPERFQTSFERRRMRLSCGGDHELACVSENGRFVGTITTGTATTARGKLAVGKLTKVRADIYFLLLMSSGTKFVAVTDATMFELLLKEQREHQRIPAEIQIHLVPLPIEIQERLARSQLEASVEVSPAQ